MNTTKHLILFLTIIIFTMPLSSSAQNQSMPKAYNIYDAKGKTVKDFEKWTQQLAEYDVILFGEFHNNAINHWLQLELVKSLSAVANKKLVLGAEMFERDDQIVVDEYLQGKITAKQLESEAKLWDNFDTDYKPILDYCKEKNLKFVASNVPRRYASLVSKNGISSLAELAPEAQVYFYSSPFEISDSIPGYAEMKAMMGHGHGHGGGMNAENFVAAQAIKDITMAESIVKNLKTNEVLVHLNGDFHSKSFGGIAHYLTKLNPSLKVAVISIVESDVDSLSEDQLKQGDFVIWINSSVTKTY